ncbi:unnamed protein product, partial [Clonostachys rhizophaga]
IPISILKRASDTSFLHSFSVKPITIALLGAQTATQPATAAVVSNVGGIKDLNSAARREVAASPAVLKPLPAISLDPDLLKAPEDSNFPPDPIEGGVKALIDTTLKRPAILLEHLSGLGSIKCSGSDIDRNDGKIDEEALTINLGVRATSLEEEFKPLAISASPFSIPRILDVGPTAGFGLGIEFGAEGTLNVTSDVAGGMTKGKVHLDLLDTKKATTSGWTPSVKVASEVDALVTLQINPFIELSLAVGVKAFDGLLDLSTGVEIEPKVVNLVSDNGTVAIESASGIKFGPPPEGQCKNAAWFASSSDLDINAFVSLLFKKTIYEYNDPIIRTKE